jgi:predicted MFS family arabinose efflux permease
MSTAASVRATGGSLRRMLVPLALAQFICSFAGSNMDVMIKDISHDLHTTVQAVQVCITLFLLVMAALMIPRGKLTDPVPVRGAVVHDPEDLPRRGVRLGLHHLVHQRG